jgi:DME family drug/metabolite transporter
MSARHTSSPAARPAAGLPYLVMSGMLWGTGGLTGSLLSRHAGLGPVAVASYRLSVGGALIVTFLVLTGRRWLLSRAAWTRIVAVGALGATFQGCYFAAVSLTSVSLATLVTIGAAPVLVLAAERATGRRRVDRSMVGTLALALTGLGLLLGLPAGGFGAAAVLASAGLAVLAAGGFATVTVLGAEPVPGLDDLTTVGLGFTVGGLLLAPLAATTAGLAFRPDLPAVCLLVVLSTGPTAAAYTLYFRGLRTVDATTAAVLTLLEPLTAALLAALVLGDRLGPAGIAGAVLLAAAVVLAGRARAAAVSSGPLTVPESQARMRTPVGPNEPNAHGPPLGSQA